MRQARKHKKQRSPRTGFSDRYIEESWNATDADWDFLLRDDFVDDEYGEYDNGPNGRNSSNWQDPQDGFSSSGRGNALKRAKRSEKYEEAEEDNYEDPKRWRTPMGDW
jgi:hypothetical protein